MSRTPIDPKILDRSYLCLGAIAAVTEILALRELFCESGGQEIGLAVGLSAWLLLVAAGNLLGDELAQRAPRAVSFLYAAGWLCLGAALFFETFFLRGARAFLFAAPGMALALTEFLGLALFAMAPPALLAGALCPLGIACGRASGAFHGPAEQAHAPVRRLYLIEGVGAALGALGLTLVLRFLSLPTPFLFLLATMAALAVCVELSLPSPAAFRGGKTLRRGILAALFLLLVLEARSSSLTAWMERKTLPNRYPYLAQNAVPPGRYRVKELPEGQLVWIDSDKPLPRRLDRAYLSGSLLYDRENRPEAYERMVLPMLCAMREEMPYPAMVVDGVWNEEGMRGALKWSPIRAAGNLATLEVLGMIEDPRDLRDGRGKRLEEILRDALPSNAAKGYALIVLGTPPPETVSANRFYTREAFAGVNRSLAPGGVFSFALPASRNRTATALARYLAVVLRTAGDVFPYTCVYPGLEAGNIVACSDRPLPSGRVLAERWDRLGAEYGAFTPEFLVSLDTSLHAEELNRALQAVPPTPENTGLFPVAPLYAYFARMQRLSGGADPGERLLRLRPRHVFALLGGVACLMILLQLSHARKDSAGVHWMALVFTAAALGFTNLSFTGMVILAAQSATGAVYLMLGLVVAAFMAGLTLAAWLSNREAGGRVASLIFILLGLSGLVFLALWIIPYCVSSAPRLSWMALPLLQAALGGLSATAFLRICRLRRETGIGYLFGADLAGSALGGLIGGAVLLPLMGIETLGRLLITLLVAAALVLLTGWGRISPRAKAAADAKQASPTGAVEDFS
ncbi:MAG: hypothetical protein V1918_06260 [Planctomycetota bacterium]